MSSGSSRRSFLSAGLGLSAAAPAAPKVSYRTLGRTGLKVSSVGFGCGTTADPTVITLAVDMGITYFDTGRVYQNGNNERMVAAGLKGVRDRVVLATKSISKKGDEALGHLETSLKELGTDHLDVWLMHARDNAAAIPDEAVAAWQKAKQQGKTRFIGVSTHNPNAVVDRILEAKFDVVLCSFNFTVGTAQDAALNRLHEAGIGLVAMKVMAPASPIPGKGQPSAALMKRADGPLAALKWVLRDQRFATTIPGTTDTDQLEMNFRGMSESLTAEDEKLLAAINEEIRPLYCRMCYRCAGQCPHGVPVADTLRYLSYADFYGQFAMGREHFLALPEEVRNVRCADCSSCAINCPNGVHVPQRLMKAQELFA